MFTLQTKIIITYAALATLFIIIVAAIVDTERTIVVFLGVAFLLLTMLVSIFVVRQFTKPMTTIADAMQRIRAGDLDARVSINGSNEMAVVGNAVNEMVEKLKDDVAQLKKLERVRSEFLGNVSHELRTPIFSMQGFLETLIEGAVDDPNVNRDFLKKAHSHSQRLNTLLGDLITISHIESGEMKMSFRYFNLYEFLCSLIEVFRPTAELHGVQLQLANGVVRDIEVLGDKERLRVVFDNLLENAIKYNKSGGIVMLAYELHNDKVLVRVSDTGVGIAAEHLPRIFERFYRVDRNRSRQVGGTGLGLAIVKHILEAHGTQIEVESEVGKGSEFAFELKT